MFGKKYFLLDTRVHTSRGESELEKLIDQVFAMSEAAEQAAGASAPQGTDILITYCMSKKSCPISESLYKNEQDFVALQHVFILILG